MFLEATKEYVSVQDKLLLLSFLHSDFRNWISCFVPIYCSSATINIEMIIFNEACAFFPKLFQKDF